MKKDHIIYKLYKLLTKKQKFNFIIIIFIMIISAFLGQLLPIVIGKLTDDILAREYLSLISVIPFLLFILSITIVNKIIKVIKRLIVEDTCTSCEKTARSRAISSLLHAPLSYFKKI